MRKSLISLAALATAATAAPAFAQEADAGNGITISGEATVVSDYRFRGVSLSDKDFAIQGSITASHDSGFYIGTWGSSLTNGAYGATEIDVFGGFSANLTDAVSADVGVTYYLYPDAPSFTGDTDYVELYGSLGTTVGPVEASIGAAYAPDQDAYAEALYLWVDGGVGIPNSPISLTAHVGRTAVDAPEDNDYFDWSVGASVSYDALTLGVAYVDTDVSGVREFSDGVVFSLSAGF